MCATIVSTVDLTSPAFMHEQNIPTEFTAAGSGAFPPLHIAAVPPATTSLALIVDDPDVPKSRRPSGIFDHWVVWNLPPSTTAIERLDAVPGIVGLNSRGEHGYVPPGPPPGTGSHRYYFTLYALDCSLTLDPATTKDELLAAIDGHIITTAVLLGRYETQS